MESTTLATALKDAGVRMSTKDHPGKGRGQIKVTRHDVEGFFLANRDLFYQPTAVASAIHKPTKSVATHLHRMCFIGTLICQNDKVKYGERAYRVADNFKKLSSMYVRAHSDVRPAKEVAEFGAPHNGESQSTSPPPVSSALRIELDTTDMSISDQLSSLSLTLGIVHGKLMKLSDDYAKLKAKVGEIL